jgi:hypothetical protein
VAHSKAVQTVGEGETFAWASDKGWPLTPSSITRAHLVVLFYAHKAVSGVARMQGGWPAAIFYPLRHPTPYAYGHLKTLWFLPRFAKDAATLAAAAEQQLDSKTSQAVKTWGKAKIASANASEAHRV